MKNEREMEMGRKEIIAKSIMFYGKRKEQRVMSVKDTVKWEELQRRGGERRRKEKKEKKNV